MKIAINFGFFSRKGKIGVPISLLAKVVIVVFIGRFLPFLSLQNILLTHATHKQLIPVCKHKSGKN